MLVPRLGRPLAGHRRRRAPARWSVPAPNPREALRSGSSRASRGCRTRSSRPRAIRLPRRGPGGTPVVLAVPRCCWPCVVGLRRRSDGRTRRRGRRRRGRRRAGSVVKPGLVGGVLGGLRGAAPRRRGHGVELVGLRGAVRGGIRSEASDDAGPGPGPGWGAAATPCPGRNSSRAGGSPAPSPRRSPPASSCRRPTRRRSRL